MSFSDPQSLTISGTAISLPRTGFGQDNGTFTSADGLVRMKVSSAYGKRVRRTLRVEHSKVAADPFVSGLQSKFSGTVYIVTDFPTTGYSVTEQKAIVDALTAYLTATTGARVSQLLGGEN